MKIGFTYNIKDPAFSGTDSHAEYETHETIAAIAEALSNWGTVVDLPCDPTLAGRLVHNRPDMVFNIAEGGGSRDRESFVPAICAMIGIPFTGSDAVALGVTMDKGLAKDIARSAGIRTTDHVICREMPSVEPSFGFPVFVKPAWDGSSRGVFRDALVKGMDALRERVNRILADYRQPAIVEPYLAGRDFCVAIIGNSPPAVLVSCEVLLGHEDNIPFFSYEYKRLDTDRLDMHPAVPLCDIHEMEQSALVLWDRLGLRDYARFDFRTDASGKPFLLEINALPGLSPVSGIFIRQASASGLSYSAVIEKIMERSARLAGILV